MKIKAQIVNSLKYFFTNSWFSQIKYQSITKIITQVHAQSEVKSVNFFKFISASHAGNEISCLTQGINLQLKVEISQCSLKNLSNLSTFSTHKSFKMKFLQNFFAKK